MKSIKISRSIKIILVSLFITIVLLNSVISAAVTEPLKLNVIAPSQAKPGDTLRIAISISNLDEVMAIDTAQPAIQQVDALNKSISARETKVTIKEIEYETHFLIDKKEDTNEILLSLSTPQLKKIAINKDLFPSSDAFKVRESLKIELQNKYGKGNLSRAELESYVEHEKQLNTFIAQGKHTELIEIPIPNYIPEGTTVTIPIKISYSKSPTNPTSSFSSASSESAQSSSQSIGVLTTFATVTVTSTPSPKRVVIFIVDGARNDMMYNTAADGLAGNISALMSNGVYFTQAKTVFPSITPPGHSAALTGAYPAKNGIVGFRWFNKTTQEYIDYSDILNMLIARVNQDLTTPTIFEAYEAANSSKTTDSVIEFVRNGADHVTAPSLMWLFHYVDCKTLNYIDSCRALDEDAMNSVLNGILPYYSTDMMVIWLLGTDLVSHKLGPDATYGSGSMSNVDAQIGRLLNDPNFLPIKDETIFVITADHGQTKVTDDTQGAISINELITVLEDAGYYGHNPGYGIEYWDYRLAQNGGMEQIYFQHDLTLNDGNMNDGDWDNPPRWEDIQPAAQAFLNSENNLTYGLDDYIDFILVRWDTSDGYKVYIDGGGTQDLETFFAGKESQYPDAVERIKNLDSKRSGDIILGANYSLNDGYANYFEENIENGTHGGLGAEDTYIPLIISGPGITPANFTSARNIDMAPTIAKMLGFSMSNADGVYLFPPKPQSVSMYPVVASHGQAITIIANVTDIDDEVSMLDVKATIYDTSWAPVSGPHTLTYNEISELFVSSNVYAPPAVGNYTVQVVAEDGSGYSGVGEASLLVQRPTSLCSDGLTISFSPPSGTQPNEITEHCIYRDPDGPGGEAIKLCGAGIEVYDTDETLFGYFAIDNVETLLDYSLEWWHRNPSGDWILYQNNSGEIPPEPPGGIGALVALERICVNGYPAADMAGNWAINLSIEGVHQYSDYFTLIDTMGPSVSAIKSSETAVGISSSSSSGGEAISSTSSSTYSSGSSLTMNEGQSSITSTPCQNCSKSEGNSSGDINNSDFTVYATVGVNALIKENSTYFVTNLKGEKRPVSVEKDDKPVMKNMSTPIIVELSKGPKTKYVPGEVIVKFKRGVVKKERGKPLDIPPLSRDVEDALSKHGGKIKKRIYNSNSFVVDVPVGEEQKFIDAIKNNPNVEYIELNGVVQALYIPNDPFYASKPPYTQWHYPLIHMQETWDLSKGSPNVVVAVIDTGVKYDHPDLDASMWTNASGYYGYDWVNDDSDPMDDHGHGTFCAGIIAAEMDNGMYGTGIAPESKIMALKVLDASGSGTAADVASAIRYAADNGAKIISMSLGGGYSATMEEAANYAYDKGVVLVGAAGNDGVGQVLYPAKFDSVIAVSSITYPNQRSDFSNYGPEIELAAPGGGDWDGDGYQWGDNDLILSIGLDPSYMYGGYGTSFAAPHVSGIIALLLTQYPYMSPEEVRISLQNNADDLGPVGWDQEYGYGRVAPPQILTGDKVTLRFDSAGDKIVYLKIREDKNVINATIRLTGIKWSGSYPTSPSLDVGNDTDVQWNYAGTFNISETTLDFSSEINEYIASHTPDPTGYYAIPVVFTSNTAGGLEISNFYVNYLITLNNVSYEDSINITVGAMDNSNLDTIELHWYDGSWHAQTWTPGSSSFSQAYDLGKFSVGTTIQYYAEAYDGYNNRQTDIYEFTVVDTIPPTLTIYSPQNITYNTSSVDLNYSIIEDNLDWVSYSLDGLANVTTSGEITTFSDGASSKTITFTAPVSDTSAAIKIPKDATVSSASMDVRYGSQKTEIIPVNDISLEKNACKGTFGPNFPDAGRSTCVNCDISCPGWDIIYYHRNVMKFSLAAIDNNLEITNTELIFDAEYFWEGCKGLEYSLYYSSSDNWDDTTSLSTLWDLPTEASPIETKTNCPSSPSFNVTEYFINDNNALDDEISFKIISNKEDYIVDTAYVVLGNPRIDYTYPLYPTNPSINIGNDGDTEWSYSGEFNTTSNWNDGSCTGGATCSSFVSELNSLLSTCTPDGNNDCTIPIKVSSDSAGIIELSSLSIKYYSNTTLTGVPDDQHYVTVYANDTSGNLGSTIVWFTVDTTPPTITIQSPLNQIYKTNTVDLNYTVTDALSNIDWVGYSLDGQANVTLVGNTSLIGLSDGPHSVTIYANDTAGNMNSSTVYFTIDATPPTITITSPENRTYNTSSVDLNYSINETNLDWVGYSLDGQANVTTSGEITTFSDGVSSKTITFTAPGSDTSAAIKIPTGAVITSASMDVSGDYVLIDFPLLIANPSFEYIGDWSYSESTLCIFPPCPPPPLEGEYWSDWSTDGSQSYRIYLPAGEGLGRISYGKISQTINFSDIDIIYFDLKHYWVAGGGGGKTKTLAGGRGPSAQIVIGGNLYYDHPMSGEHTHLDEMIDVSSYSGNQILDLKFFTIDSLAASAEDRYAAFDNLRSIGKSYPSNVTIDVGNDGDTEWSYPGEFTGTSTWIDGSCTGGATCSSFVDELNSLLSTCTPDGNNDCTIPIKVTSDSAGIVQLDALSVEYYSSATLTNLSDDQHYVIVYANDTLGDLNSATVWFTVDTTPPTGSITINNGSTYTNSTSVVLSLSCSDASGCSEMKFSNNDITYSTPEPYATLKAWTLAEGDGTKRVYAKYKDTLGNWMTTPANDTIILDTTPPTTTDNTPIGWQNGDVTVTLTPSDALSGVANTYYCVDQTDTCSSTTIGTSVLVDTEGTYYVRYYSVDNAGNSETVKSATVQMDKTAPTITNPDDHTVAQNSTAYIDWTITEVNPDSYVIYRNGTQIAMDSYTNGQTISQNIDTSTLGLWNYTIWANDTAGKSAPDEAMTKVYMIGDVDGDDIITAADALMYLREAVGQDVNNVNPIYDVEPDTCDGTITAGDALKVLRKAVGQDVNLECEAMGKVSATLGTGSIGWIGVGGDTAGSPGTSVTTSIEVTNMSDVGSLQIDLLYDPTVIKATNVAQGNAASGALFVSNIDNQAGKITVAFISMSGVSGSGSITEITFDVIGLEGSTSPLDLSGLAASDPQNKPLATTPMITSGVFYVSGITMPVINATIDIDPDVLNLKDKGKWITAYIVLPGGYDVTDINVSTVQLGDVPAETDPKYNFVTNQSVYITDDDEDGILERMVKFKREAVAASLSPGDEVEVTLRGALNDGTLFVGSDIIKVR